MTLGTIFAAGFVRQLACEHYALSLAIKDIKLDNSQSVQLTCTPESYSVLIDGLSNITSVLLSLGNFNTVRIWDGNRLDEYRVKDLMILDPTIAPVEGFYDQALLEEQINSLR